MVNHFSTIGKYRVALSAFFANPRFLFMLNFNMLFKDPFAFEHFTTFVAGCLLYMNCPIMLPKLWFVLAHFPTFFTWDLMLIIFMIVSFF